MPATGAGSPLPINPTANGFDMEEIVRKAQLHMKQNLARNDVSGHDGLRANHSVRESNGHNRGVKREAAPDTAVRDSQQVTKRSRLGVSAAEARRHDSGQHSVEQDQMGQNPVEGDGAYESVMHMVQQVQANRVSRLARDAKDCLRNLDAAEGIGVIAWLVDGMLTQRTDDKSKDMIADWVADLGSFIRYRTQ